jgi:hypothetical protein
VQVSKYISLKDDLVYIKNYLIDLGLEVIILAELKEFLMVVYCTTLYDG